MGIYYIENYLENVDTITAFCDKKSIDPKKAVFLFPGNKTHHGDKSNLYSIKSGGGLASIAGQWGNKGYPTLSLPTTDMDKYANDTNIQKIVHTAVGELWKAIYKGYSLILPVRRHQNQTYFQGRSIKV